MRVSATQPIHKFRLFKTQKTADFWQSAFLTSILAAAAISISGLILCGLSHFNFAANHQAVNTYGTLLILFAAPVYFFAAHCLDKADERKKS